MLPTCRCVCVCVCVLVCGYICGIEWRFNEKQRGPPRRRRRITRPSSGMFWLLLNSNLSSKRLKSSLKRFTHVHLHAVILAAFCSAFKKVKCVFHGSWSTWEWDGSNNVPFQITIFNSDPSRASLSHVIKDEWRPAASVFPRFFPAPAFRKRPSPTRLLRGNRLYGPTSLPGEEDPFKARWIISQDFSLV